MCHDLTTAQNQADKLWNREFCRGHERAGEISFCHIPLPQMTRAHTQCTKNTNEIKTNKVHANTEYAFTFTVREFLKKKTGVAATYGC